jgi:hypothetical protein
VSVLLPRTQEQWSVPLTDSYHRIEELLERG